MPGPSSFDQKVYKALQRPEFFPDEFTSWMPKYLHYLSSLQIGKDQIPGIGGEQWHNVGDVGQPAFQNGFTNYGAPYAPARFYKDYTGHVLVRGTVKNAGSLLGQQLIFSLPPGYRPDLNLIFAADGQVVSQGHQRIDVQASGDVFLTYPSASIVTYLSLSNVIFRAA